MDHGPEELDSDTLEFGNVKIYLSLETATPDARFACFAQFPHIPCGLKVSDGIHRDIGLH